MLNFSLLQNVERPVSPHGEVHVFAAVPCGLPVCCEGEVAAVRGRDDQSPGGASWRKRQTPPPTGPQTRHAWHKNTWHQPKSESIIYTFMPDLPNKRKRKERKEQLIWSMRSFPFLFPVIPQMQHCFILLDLVLISVLLLPPQRTAALTEKPIIWEKVQVPTETTRHCGPDPPTAHRAQQTCSGQGCEPVTCAL